MPCMFLFFPLENLEYIFAINMSVKKHLAIAFPPQEVENEMTPGRQICESEIFSIPPYVVHTLKNCRTCLLSNKV
jgi:hypothetical protein